jgi:uncharacterized membrane protein
MFPLFPWTAYAFAGAALGRIWAENPARATRSAVAMAGIGAAAALLVWEGHDLTIALLEAAPWAIQPFRVLFRLGVCLSFIGLAVGLGGGWSPGQPLRLLGRASLLVYWVHLPFAFGVLAGPMKAAEPGRWGASFAALAVAMLGVSWLRDQLRRRARKPFNRPPLTENAGVAVGS